MGNLFWGALVQVRVGGGGVVVIGEEVGLSLLLIQYAFPTLNCWPPYMSNTQYVGCKAARRGLTILFTPPPTPTLPLQKRRAEVALEASGMAYTIVRPGEGGREDPPRREREGGWKFAEVCGSVGAADPRIPKMPLPSAPPPKAPSPCQKCPSSPPLLPKPPPHAHAPPPRPGGMERPTDEYKLTHNVVLKERDTAFGGQISRLQV